MKAPITANKQAHIPPLLSKNWPFIIAAPLEETVTIFWDSITPTVPLWDPKPIEPAGTETSAVVWLERKDWWNFVPTVVRTPLVVKVSQAVVAESVSVVPSSPAAPPPPKAALPLPAAALPLPAAAAALPLPAAAAAAGSAASLLTMNSGIIAEPEFSASKHC